MALENIPDSQYLNLMSDPEISFLLDKIKKYRTVPEFKAFVKGCYHQFTLFISNIVDPVKLTFSDEFIKALKQQLFCINLIKILPALLVDKCTSVDTITYTSRFRPDLRIKLYLTDIAKQSSDDSPIQKVQASFNIVDLHDGSILKQDGLTIAFRVFNDFALRNFATDLTLFEPSITLEARAKYSSIRPYAALVPFSKLDKNLLLTHVRAAVYGFYNMEDLI